MMSTTAPAESVAVSSDLGSAIRRAVDAAVSLRFLRIRPRLRERVGEYRYDRLVCVHEQLGPMFRVELSLRLGEPGGLTWTPPEWLPSSVLSGDMDRLIEETWHEAARGAWEDLEHRRELE